MIIRSNKIKAPQGGIGDTLVDLRVNGDQFHTKHIQEITPILMDNYKKRQDERKGFSDSKEFQKIGSIPMLLWLQHPEWAEDEKVLLKWLRSSEGELFRTVPNGI